MPPPEGGIREAQPLVYESHSVELDRYGMATVRVTLGQAGVHHLGEARGGGSKEHRLRLIAKATLSAINGIPHTDFRRFQSLNLHGVKEVKAFGRCFVLVAVHAVRDREAVALTGLGPVEDSREAAAIAATLQATDRWIQGSEQN